jgi:hypothetical protein
MVGNWGWITSHVIHEWTNSRDTVLPANTEICTFLKSFNGAPPFTQDELRIWEEGFAHIGMVRVGRYPAKYKLANK